MTTQNKALTTTAAASTTAALILLAGVMHFGPVKATVKWQPTAGDTYKLYKGNAPGNYITTLNPGTTGTYNFLVTRRSTHYFALSAVRGGIESAKSKEYKYTAPNK